MRPRRHPFSIALLAVGVTLTAGACSGDDGGGSDTVINDATISSDTSSPGVDPTVSIMSPSADARFLPDETVAFEAHVDGRGEALAGLEFRVESSANDRGDALKVGSVPESGVIGATFAALKPGAQTITVSVLRAGSVVCSASVDIEVRTPGAAPTLAIAPETPRTGDTVNATVTPPDGVVGDAHYRWLRAAEAITTDAPLSAA
ncbi:MAG: hypothetical protein KC635_05335, partial [Myxococcales bacterium]|nr:hypothetical protein [Myxococcales bacterium]